MTAVKKLQKAFHKLRNVGEFPRSWILNDCIQVRKEKLVIAYLCPSCHKSSHHEVSRCNGEKDVTKMYQKVSRTVLLIKPSLLLSSLLKLLIFKLFYDLRVSQFIPFKPLLEHLLRVGKVILRVERIKCFDRIHIGQLLLTGYLKVPQMVLCIQTHSFLSAAASRGDKG